MDSATRTALMNLTGELRLTNPAAANEVLNYLNGKGQLSASTLLLIRPRLLSQGVDIAALDKPASPLANEGIPDPLGTANNGKPFIQHDNQGKPLSYHSGVGGLDPGDLSGLPDVKPPVVNGPGARDQNTTVNQISGAAPGQAPGTATSTPNGGGGTLPGNFTAMQGGILASPQGENQLQRFALQAAGLNPDRMGRFGQIVAGMLAPLIAARRNAFGITQGSQNVGGLPQDIVNFAKEFTTPGVDAFGHAQQYAQGILGSPELRAYTGALANPDQAQAVYQSLMPLLFAGSNPLIQQAAADTAERTQNLYGDITFANSGAAPNNGIFNDWLNANQQNFDPLQRRIFGLR